MTERRALGVRGMWVGLLAMACSREEPSGGGAPDGGAPADVARPEGGPNGGAQIFLGPGAPPTAPEMFGGADDPARAPQIVYPDDGVVVPPNMRELEIHYTGASGLVELAIDVPGAPMRIYFVCPEAVGGGCIYAPDDAVWDAVAAAARGRGPINYRLRASVGGSVGTSETRTIAFAEEDITGGLYYWAATSGTIKRYEWGRRGEAAETYLDTGRAGAALCLGCHALSRDGTRLGVGTDTPTTTFQVYDVATRTRIFQNGPGGALFPTQPNYASFSPDATQIVQSGYTGLRIIDGANGMTLLENLGGGPAAQPDWSPDGDHIVYAAHDTPVIPGLVDLTGVSSARIVRLDRMGASWVVGPTLVATPGANNYYPAYSPDGAWVVYIHSPSNQNSLGSDMGMNANGVPDARLWIVPSDGTGLAAELAHASGHSDSWPKWDPTVYMDRGGALFWLSWSSSRQYGLRLAQGEKTQLWMAAFRPEDARSGMDGSAAAFRVPFQEITSGNHIPQWTTTIARMACTNDMDCGGELCIDGLCYGPII